MIAKKHSELVSQRFLTVVQQIIADKIDGVNTQSKFADKVGFPEQNFSKILLGQRSPTIDLLCETCLKFKVNPTWLLLGQGAMFSSGATLIDMSFLERIDALEKTVKKQKKPLHVKAS